MKSITTTYYGPTNTRGARIRATDNDGNSVTLPYPHELSGEECHRAAVIALCDKMGWSGTLAHGGHARGYVYVWVAANGHNVFPVGE